MKYHQDSAQNRKHHFEAREERLNGPEYEDGCRNCGWRFCDHYNGACPENEDES